MFISLRPATYVMGSNVNLGSFGVIGVKFWFSLKMHYSYVTKYFHVILTFASHLRDKQGNVGQSGVDVSKPAGYAVCDGNMSSFVLFFFLSSLLPPALAIHLCIISCHLQLMIYLLLSAHSIHSMLSMIWLILMVLVHFLRLTWNVELVAG